MGEILHWLSPKRGNLNRRMSLSHSEVCHNGHFIREASNKIHNQPPLEAPGCWRLRVYTEMWKEEPWCQRFLVWWSKQKNQTKKKEDWAASRARLRSGPRRSGTEEPCGDPNQENRKEERHLAARGLELQPAHSSFSLSGTQTMCQVSFGASSQKKCGNPSAALS